MGTRHLFTLFVLLVIGGLAAVDPRLTGQTVSPPLFDAFAYDTDGDGVVDEFDDHPSDGSRAFDTVEPTRGERGRVAFEADWPLRGDDDFNDAVFAYRFVKTASADGHWVEWEATIDVVATGTTTPLGVAISFPRLASVLGRATVSRDFCSAVPVEPEDGTRSVFVLTDNMLDTAGAFPGAGTEGESFVGERFVLTVQFQRGIPIAKFDGALDLFVFYTDEPSREIHRPGVEPTDFADLGLFGTFDDASDLRAGRTYLSDAGLPWAIELPHEWQHPKEGADLAVAYPELVDWIESGGDVNRTWSRAPNVEEVRP
ncbi:MAG: LruC domain-containing protein [Planctomycetota bacterium]